MDGGHPVVSDRGAPGPQHLLERLRAETTEQGQRVATGVPGTFKFVHNTESATRMYGVPKGRKMNMPEISMKKAEELLGPDLPGSEAQLSQMRAWLQEMIEEEGEEAIRQKAGFLRKEWDYVLTLL